MGRWMKSVPDSKPTSIRWEPVVSLRSTYGLRPALFVFIITVLQGACDPVNNRNLNCWSRRNGRLKLQASQKTHRISTTGAHHCPCLNSCNREFTF